LSEAKSPVSVRGKPKIFIFGNFGTENFGNEATLKAIHFNLRRLLPETEFACICSFPANVSATHDIAAFPISPTFISGWTPKSWVARICRKIALGIPNELYRWVAGFRLLKGVDALIIPGTGLLTDVHDLISWGPYGLFRWSVLAKLRGCKLLFVSVGAGPLYGRLGRRFAKWALGLSDFRSYRDNSSREYLEGIGFATTHDHVYPDLAFSLPPSVNPGESQTNGVKPVVGVGLMIHEGMYGDVRHDDETYRRYMETMVAVTKWLLDRGYDIRLLIGQVGDPASEFRALLNEKLSEHDPTRIVYTRASSVQALLAQFSDTRFVIVTRFHNIVFALLNNKPVISISFHSKCTSLMSDMDLSEYCLQIDRIEIDELVRTAQTLEKNVRPLAISIAGRTETYRQSLDEQYQLILNQLGLQCRA
jgi:polysaccharide pyruvyl transferase WcaK-like protein